MLKTLTNSLQKKRNEEAGFTLIELLVVILIIGILSAIVVVAVRGSTSQAGGKACSQNAANLLSAIENYEAKADTGLEAGGAFPATDIASAGFAAIGLTAATAAQNDNKVKIDATGAAAGDKIITGVWSTQILAGKLVPDYIRSIPSQYADAQKDDGVFAVKYDISGGKTNVIGVLCVKDGGKNAGI